MKKPDTGITVFLIIIVVAVLLLIFTTKSKKSDSTKAASDSVTLISKQHSEYIAAIYLEGEITEKTKKYDQKWILKTIDELKKDSNNKAIALFINSPGGSVYEADEVYLKLKDYKTAGKKIYVYQGSLAASGGYYISCAGDMIYANRNTLTGSIGVIAGQSFDISELLQRYGIKSETIHAGKNKNMGNFNEPLSDEQRSILQSVADECYDQFTQIVSEDRNLKIEEVRRISDGRIYTAKQALNLKLIDKIDSWENMLDELKSDIQDKNCNVIDFRVPQENPSILELLNSLNSQSFADSPSTLQNLPNAVQKELYSDIKYPAYIYR